MQALREAERHLRKADQYQSDADDALTEAMRFDIAGEVDENGIPAGDAEESKRMLALHSKLVEKALLHTAKANAILDELKAS